MLHEDAAAERERSRVAHAARRAEMPHEDAAAERERNRVAHQQARAAEPDFPFARRAIPAEAPTQRYVLNRANVVCRDCAALHWIEERVRAPGSTLANPHCNMCCDRGKVANIPPLAQPPEPLRSLLRDQTPIARAFRQNIRAYNSALAFTSLGANWTIASLKVACTCSDCKAPYTTVWARSFRRPAMQGSLPSFTLPTTVRRLLAE